MLHLAGAPSPRQMVRRSATGGLRQALPGELGRSWRRSHTVADCVEAGSASSIWLEQRELLL